jgi:predicted MFS family arabinose efflux permease
MGRLEGATGDERAVEGRVSASPGAVPRSGVVTRLAIAQALAGANAVVVFATGAVIGNMLAPERALATLPISIFVVGMSACTLPAGALARHRGRRAAFLAGAGCGVIGGLLSTLAVLLGAFWLFCAATFFCGAYGAVVLSFRFAAADSAPPGQRARALSTVMAGGVVAGVLGPQLVTFTMELWAPHLFAATFLAQAAVAVLSGLVLLGVRLPRPEAPAAVVRRSMWAVVRQPRFVTAAICGAVSYAAMNFLMTAAPLAMRFCGHSQADANLGVQWHVIAMYAPSFFTGRLISRFGASLIVACGLAMLAAAAAMGLSGVDVGRFWLTLILLGVGWNFGFTGASALVLECHRPEEATAVQARYDLIVFATVAAGSFSSGGLLTAFGWDAVLWVSLLPIAFAAIALAVEPAFRPARSRA